MSAQVYNDGLMNLENILSEYAKKADNFMDALEIGATELVNDVRKLPKPRSDVRKSGYTHLLDSVTKNKTTKEIEVGWGKYYGTMVEKGTKRMRGTPHFAPTFEKNKEKYYKKMIGGLG